MLLHAAKIVEMMTSFAIKIGLAATFTVVSP
jgi:hypothetical protein